MCFCFLLNKVLSFLKFLLTSLTNHPQRQRLIRARVGPEEGAASGEEGSGASGPWGRENGTAPEGERQPPEGELERGKETVGETCGGGQPKEQEEEEEEQEDQDEENVPFKPFVLPGKKGRLGFCFNTWMCFTSLCYKGNHFRCEFIRLTLD